MNEEQKLVVMLKQHIATAPQEVQDEIHEAADKIRAIVKDYSAAGDFALALVGAEVAASEALQPKDA